jgi:hypothetical protein
MYRLLTNSLYGFISWPVRHVTWPYSSPYYIYGDVSVFTVGCTSICEAQTLVAINVCSWMHMGPTYETDANVPTDERHSFWVLV